LRSINRLKKMNIILLNLLLILMFSNIDFASEELSPEEALSKIESSLKLHDRESAYDQMKTLKSNLTFEQSPEIYLENLLYLVKIEKMYIFTSEMVKNAIELYELSSESQYASYRVYALDALAYFDYLNYDNSKAAEKLAEMATYTDINQSFQYKLNLALLEIDNQEFDKALDLFDEVIEMEKSKPGTLLTYFNDIIIIHNNIAKIYFEQEKFDEAIENSLVALNYIGEQDYDFLVETKLNLAYFYYSNKAYDKAQLYVDKIYKDFDKTSELFSNVLSIDAVKSLEANLAYDAGDYKKSSELYFELNQAKDNSNAVENSLEANKTVNDFESLQTNKQLSVLEQLAAEQVEKNKAQSKYIKAATMIIILLLVLILTFIWMIRWYNKQRMRLYRLSITDQLTQIFNRRMIIDEFERVIIGTKFIALMDIDYFKKINDQYGHVVGDKVLIKIAETIKNSLRSNDIVGRYGGEEFLAIIDTSDLDSAIDIAERIRQSVENIDWEYPDLVTTISIGLTKVTQRGDGMLAEVDHLLYQSKLNGRNLLTYNVSQPATLQE